MAAEGGGLTGAVRLAPRRHAPPAMAEIFAALPVAALLIAPDGVIAEVNASAEMLLNIGRPAMLGERFDRLLRLPPAIIAALDSADAGPLRAYDVEIVTMRGMMLKTDLTMAATGDQPGWRTFCLHPSASASSRRDGSLSAMGAAAMLAHEIKNPLSGIKGAAQLIARDSNEQGRGLTRLIAAEVDRIAALIDRMADFADARPLPLAAHNLHAMIADVRDLALAGFASGIAIREHYDPSLPPAMVNADALTQVLINLLKNAAEAVKGRADARITLHTAYRHGPALARHGRPGWQPLPIELAVADNGGGVAPGLAGHLFEPFVSTKPTGGGLGLALCDKLMRDMGGTIDHSREQGETFFRLRLARAPGT